MPNMFVVSDTHFSHSLLCTATAADGSKVRPWTDVAAMDEALIDAWNSVVRPGDKVYHLGDVVMARRALPMVMARLAGKKVLVRGNHDIYGLKDYARWFYDIRGAYVFEKRFLLTHLPIHPSSLDGFALNVHGHTHHAVVTLPDGQPDARYYNACIEKSPLWAPIEISEVRAAAARLDSRAAGAAAEPAGDAGATTVD